MTAGVLLQLLASEDVQPLVDVTGSGGVVVGGTTTVVDTLPRTVQVPGERRWSFWYELLDGGNVSLGELADVESCTVTQNWLSTIKRTATFELAEPEAGDVDWASDRIRPWARLWIPPYGATDYAQWPLGVFVLSSPGRTSLRRTVRRTVSGYDLLQVYSDDLVADRYTVTAGTAYTDAVSTLLGDVDKVIGSSESTLGVDLEWDPGTSKLEIINDLLGSVNYQSLSVDEWGQMVVAPYVLPADRGVEWTYDHGDSSLLIHGVVQDLDLYAVANKWVGVVSTTDDDTVLTSTVTNDDPASPTSTVRRGRTIVDYRTYSDIADQDTLDAKIAAIAEAASSAYETVEFSGGFNPLHSGNDVIRLVDPVLGIDAKYVETYWSASLAVGSPMQHRARRVVDI